MNRSLQLGQKAIVIGDTEAVLEITQPEVSVVALEIALLARSLSDVLSLFTRGGPKIVMRLLGAPGTAKRAHVSCSRSGEIQFDVPLNLLEYLEAALLRAYRDGIAEAGHVHIEGKRDGAPFDLTVMFELSAPPVTPAEVERMMMARDQSK